VKKRHWATIWTTCLACVISLQAQNPEADSLLRLLKSPAPDSQRVIWLTDLAWSIKYEYPDIAAKRYWEAIWVAQQCGFKRGEALGWSGLGNIEDDAEQYEAALQHHLKALDIRRQIGDRRGISASLNNLGKVSESRAQYNDAIEYHHQNIRILTELHDTIRLARAHFNLAGAYQTKGLYIEAMKNVTAARSTFENIGDTSSLALVYDMMGHIQFELEQFSEALLLYERANELYRYLDDSLRLSKSIGNIANTLDEWGNTEDSLSWMIPKSIEQYKVALTMSKLLGDSIEIAAIYNNMGDASKHLGQFDQALSYLQRALLIRQQFNDRAGIMETFNAMSDVYFGMKNFKMAKQFLEQYYAIAIEIKDEKFEQKAYKDFAKIYSELGDYQKAFEYRIKYDELRYKRLNEMRIREFDRNEVEYIRDRQQRDRERQQAALAIKEAAIQRERAIRNGLTGGAIALGLVVLLLYNRSRLRAKSNIQLAAKNKTIERERRRADELLMNILPESAARELKEHNTVKPVRYEAVTVLFTDFKGFTKIAETVTPEELIGELDECFRLFDAIVAKHGLEKIKTIGDAYMCAGGLPSINDSHPFDAVRAAIEMQQELALLMAQKQVQGKPTFEMRVGMHTGPVVAGVVGTHKFAYDIWGDTVNLAARMEQNSEPNRINISGETYALVKDHFTCTFRGEIPAKNKGHVAMYFVEF
jgi:adenylate cyclase